MKKYIQLLLIACLAVGISSCRGPKQDRTIEEAPVEEQRADSASSDSSVIEESKLIQELLVRVDSLSASCDSLKAGISKTDKEIKEMKSITYSWNLATAFSVIAAVIACIICIYLLVKLSENEEKTKKLKAEKDSLEQKLVDVKTRLTENEKLSLEIKDVVNKHKDLIDELNARGKTKQSGRTEVVISTGPSRPRFEPQTRYAEVNTGNYFLELLTSRSETCIFELTLMSETEAEYTIVSINKIKSFNGWESAITCDGDVQLARDFRLVHKGKCQLTSDGAWKITKKLEINAI